MPSVGNRKSATSAGRGYMKSPIGKLAGAFNEAVQDILSESGIDLYSEPRKAMMVGASNSALENFFIENSVDPAEFTDPEDLEDAIDTMREQYANDREGIMEAAALNSFNPVIGMTFPIHKNVLMNNIFDKGAIPKVVAREPKFTISMETRTLITPDGKEIDMFKEQYKMMDAIDSTAPQKDIELALPQAEGATDLMTALGATADDDLSIDTYVSAAQISVYLAVGDVNPETGEKATAAGNVDVWFPVNVKFTPYYGEYDRAMMQAVSVAGKDSTGKAKEYKDVLSGYMQKNKVCITSTTGVVKKVKLRARIDTSSAMVNTCSVSWKARTEVVEIPSANPINVPVSPEEVKDVGALYQVNQISKILSLIHTVLGNYKDDKIKKHLDESYTRLPDTNKLATTFDFAPRAGYALDHVEWRHKTFMDALDSHVTNMLQVLNDPNMTVNIIGRSDLIRRITPVEYTYQTPTSIGPVELDFVKTVMTSDRRTYQFISSDKLRGNNNLIVILCPRNSERIIYQIYDYQMYVSNEIRNLKNHALPAIHAFERWKFVEYQPVQGRVKILNPDGQLYNIPNDDPIGTFEMNDWNSSHTHTARPGDPKV